MRLAVSSPRTRSMWGTAVSTSSRQPFLPPHAVQKIAAGQPLSLCRVRMCFKLDFKKNFVL